MKIGVYGGTFNPPHLGHVTAARAVFELLKLDLLLLVPDREPPHKALPAGSPTPEQRLEMTRLAGEQLGLGDRVQVLDLELKRTGRSYTSDTLAQLKERYPEDELWLLMGTDMFLTIQTWHEAEKILSLAGIATFGRTEADTEELFSVQRDYLYRTYPQARIFTLTIPGVVDVSSTDLRTMLAKGEGVNLLPPAVYGYILREGLYGTRADLKHLPLRELRPIALSYLKNKRIPHVLGTEQEAIRLAERYGADVEKARVAALLHDCTKKLNMEEQLELCGRYGIQLDELEQKALKLLHAKTGAAIARDVFGVDDEIYNAIWWHTTGHAHMTLLEKVIYLADYIEPSRNFPGVDKLRAVCYKDLDEGLLMGLEKLLIAVAVGLAIVLIAVVACQSLFVRPDLPDKNADADSGTQEEEIDWGEGTRPRSDGERKSQDYYTVLILGRDTGGGGNTDTMLLASYDVTNQKATVMSIPRDTMVNVSWDIKKINSVYNWYGGGDRGIQYLYKEIAQLVGFEPDYQVIVEWEAVGQIVDAMGGVWFDVPRDMYYRRI